jgi:hypothetical protein
VSLRRSNPRRDGNEKAIVACLRKRGFSVSYVSGAGLPDLVVGYRGTEHTPPQCWLVEVKQPKGRFKPAQVKWRESWQGPPPIVLRSVEDAELFPVMKETR